MKSPPSINVRVTRRFSAAPERVFDAWLDPAMIGQWMIGTVVRDEKIVRIAVDSRVGGAFSLAVLRAGDEIDHIGTYLVIERPCRLSFTWGIAGESTDESRVDIEIKPVSGGCELTLTHTLDAKWQEYADRTQAGWTTMLEALGRAFDGSPNKGSKGIRKEAGRA
jgi:uncharacterized protein YndB with AHSA1/START domain